MLAASELPPEEAQRSLQEFTRMPVRFALITRSNYDELRRAILSDERPQNALSGV